MKISILALEWPDDHCHKGGVARFNYRLASALSARHQVTVITATESPSASDAFEVVNVGHPAGRFARFYISPVRARQQLKRVSNDVFISSGDDWACKPYPTARIMHGTAKAEAKSSTGLRRLNHRVLGLLERRSIRSATQLFGVGPDSIQLRDDAVWFPPVVGIPVNDASTSNGRQDVLVFIGSFHSRKRGFVAQRVWQELVALGSAYRLVVVGPDADRENWHPSVDHRSGLQDDDVRELLASARYLLSPSEYEGFGIPVYEALANGCVPICSKNPGSTAILGSELLSLQADPDQGSYVRKAIEIVCSQEHAITNRALLDRAREIYRLGDPERLVQSSS